jgi:DNA-binding CsgD family transcriptional regulator
MPPNCSQSDFLPDEVWRRITLSLRISERQSTIVRWTLSGSDEAGVADRLQISPHTVHTHMERVYRRLGVSSRSALAMCVFARYVEDGAGLPACQHKEAGKCCCRHQHVILTESTRDRGLRRGLDRAVHRDQR